MKRVGPGPISSQWWNEDSNLDSLSTENSFFSFSVFPLPSDVTYRKYANFKHIAQQIFTYITTSWAKWSRYLAKGFPGNPSQGLPSPPLLWLVSPWISFACSRTLLNAAKLYMKPSTPASFSGHVFLCVAVVHLFHCCVSFHCTNIPWCIHPLSFNGQLRWF